MKQQNEIQYRKLRGLSGQGLRIWGVLFLIVGVVLNPKLSANLASMETDFLYTSVGLIFGLLHYAAIPIFAFLLVEGFTHTSNLTNYAIRIGVMAVCVEIPFNYAMDGKLLGTFTFPNLATLELNPVFGLLLSLVLLYFFRRYSGKTLKLIALKGLLWIMAFVWVKMLGIKYGITVILLVPLQPVLQSEALLPAFNNVVPALFGALGLKYFSKSPQIAVVPLLLMSLLCVFVPSMISQTSILLIPSGGLALLIGFVLYKKNKL